MSDLTRSINILGRVVSAVLILLGMDEQADGKMDTWIFFLVLVGLGLRSHFPDFHVRLMRQEIIIGFFPSSFHIFTFLGGAIAKHGDA